MKKEIKGKPTSRPEDMLTEYDFSGGVRGKFARGYAEGTNLILLDPDIADLFPNAEAVNQALRALAQVARRQVGLSSRTTSTTLG